MDEDTKKRLEQHIFAALYNYGNIYDDYCKGKINAGEIKALRNALIETTINNIDGLYSLMQPVTVETLSNDRTWEATWTPGGCDFFRKNNVEIMTLNERVMYISKTDAAGRKGNYMREEFRTMKDINDFAEAP